MRTCSETVINARLILLVLGCWTSISLAGLSASYTRHNPLGIDWAPAPAPENGPPLSAGASRDKSLLPVQIGSIVGAYLFCVIVVGLALIFIARKLRHQILFSPKALDIEMVEPASLAYAIDPSPISPGGTNGGSRNFSWPVLEKVDVKQEISPYIYPAASRSPGSPPGVGDPHVDTQIVEADREMAQRDLGDLYAHVMEQEEAKAQGIKPQEMPLPPQLRGAGPVPAEAPQRPTTAGSRKTEKNRPLNILTDDAKSTKSRASSIMSALRSPRKNKSIRSIQISSPILTPNTATFPKDSDEEPLSPRYHTPPPPPPVPTDQIPYTHSRNTSTITPTSPTRSIAEQLGPYGPSSQQHRNNPSEASIQSYRNDSFNRNNSFSRTDPMSAISTNSTTPLYPKPTPKKPANINTQPFNNHPQPTGSNPVNAVRALPFRAFDPPSAAPSNFSSITKTTVLERKSPINAGPQTGGLKTPWSAGAVPYSPYQPFSPMIPMTPRLVTKEERKAKKKAEGKTPVRELIKSQDDLWDSGY